MCRERIQNGFGTTRRTPGSFERVRNSTLRRTVACVEARGGHFEHRRAFMNHPVYLAIYFLCAPAYTILKCRE